MAAEAADAIGEHERGSAGVEDAGDGVAPRRGKSRRCMTSEQTRKSQGFRAQPAEHHGEEHDAARQVRIERPSPQLEGEAHSADQKGQQQHGP
jgi:hypothetical protein